MRKSKQATPRTSKYVSLLCVQSFSGSNVDVDKLCFAQTVLI